MECEEGLGVKKHPDSPEKPWRGSQEKPHPPHTPTSVQSCDTFPPSGQISSKTKQESNTLVSAIGRDPKGGCRAVLIHD